MNPTDIKAKKPPKMQARQTTNRIILQSKAIAEIPENKIRLISKVSDDVISFFKAKANHPLFMDYFYRLIWNESRRIGSFFTMILNEGFVPFW